MTVLSPMTPCANCGHPLYQHREGLSPDEREGLGIEGLHGCHHNATCPCDHFSATAAQTPAEDPPPPTPPGEPRVVDADPRQQAIILALARALGATVMLNWDQLPTGLTKGFALSQLGTAALVRATGQLLASGLEHLPDSDPRIADCVEVTVEILRECFAQARQELKDIAAAGTHPGAAPPDTTPRVFVPQPKLLM